MSESFEFDRVDVFTTGTVGPKGQRIFYLQVRVDGHIVSLRLEKQQVAALAEYLARILEDLPDLTSLPIPADTSFIEPATEDWIAASMGVAYDERDHRLVVFIEETMPETDVDILDDADDMYDPATARFKLRTEQVVAFVQHARDIVAAGRPPCPYCARPLDPAFDGWCLCSN